MVAGNQSYTVAQSVKKSSMTIQDALSEYLRHKGQGKSDRFRRYAQRSVGYLIEFVGSKSLTDYSRADANALRDALIDRGLVASSIKRNFEVVRSVFNVAAKEAGLEVANPFSGVILSSAPSGSEKANTQSCCFCSASMQAMNNPCSKPSEAELDYTAYPYTSR